MTVTDSVQPESEETPKQLQVAIAAARSGEKERARRILVDILAVDEENERAWLWLSAVVQTDQERRICLENVLALNPHHGPARRGLAVLAQREQTSQEYEPHSRPAGAADPSQPSTTAAPVYRATSSYKDVWSREDDLCAYCAHEISAGLDQCPQCERRLFIYEFRYKKASQNLHIFWVLLASASQLFLLNVITDAIMVAGWPLMLLHALLSVLFLVLAVGVYFRQFWAYLSSIIIILILLLFRFLDALTFIESVVPAPVNPAEAMIISPFAQTIASFLGWLQIGALVLALLWALLFTGPDFERVRLRVVARLNRNISDPASFDAAARRYANQGLWASAILHWQRAVANAPTNRHYMRRLGEAYARLGFYRRSLDVLETARGLAPSVAEQAELDLLLRETEAQQAAVLSGPQGNDGGGR